MTATTTKPTTASKPTTILDRPEIRKLVDRLAELRSERARIAAELITKQESSVGAAAEAFAAGAVDKGHALAGKKAEGKFVQTEALEAIDKAIVIVDADLAVLKKKACDEIRVKLTPRKAATAKRIRDLLDELLTATQSLAEIDREYNAATAGDGNVPLGSMALSPRHITAMQYQTEPWLGMIAAHG